MILVLSFNTLSCCGNLTGRVEYGYHELLHILNIDQLCFIISLSIGKKLMKDELLTIFADFLDVEKSELTNNKSLEDLGIDSLTLAEFMFEIEDKFGVNLTTEMQGQLSELINLGDILNKTEEIILQQQETNG